MTKHFNVRSDSTSEKRKSTSTITEIKNEKPVSIYTTMNDM